MKPIRELPLAPRITLTCVGEPEGQPFLLIERKLLRACYPDGCQSNAFAYDSVGRRALDAVVIVAWTRVDEEVCVYLRSGVRPPLAERATHPAAGDRQSELGLWEVPAGLIEPSDFEPNGAREQGILVAAARELEEELGFTVPPGSFQTLGHGVFPSPAMTAEKQFFVSVNVEGQACNPPSLDGSPLEENAVIVLAPLSLALDWCTEGRIMDGKTELALRRFASSRLE